MKTSNFVLSNALQNAQSIEEAAAVITNGTSSFSSEMLAAQYAVDAAQDDISIENIEAHLDIISDTGAVFQFHESLSVVQSMISEEN